LGDGWVAYLVTPERFRTSLEKIETFARESKRALDPTMFEAAHVLFTVLDDDWERARAQAARQLGRQYNQPFDASAWKYCLLGPPAACLEQLDRFVAAGARTFAIYFPVPPERILEQLERFGTDVLPHVPDGAGLGAPSSAAWRT